VQFWQSAEIGMLTELQACRGHTPKMWYSAMI